MSVLNRTEAEINLENLAHNFREIKNFTNGADIIAVVKADAYGHGALEVAALYEKLGASILAVACLDEALFLRSGGISAPIMILGATPIHLAKFLTENELIQSVPSLEYAKSLDSAARELKKKISVHIKLDTGMSRFGIYSHSSFAKSAAEDVFEITKLPNLIPDGIFTHFAEAENPDTAFTDEQFESFMHVVEILKERGKTFRFCHCANSSAVVNYKRAHLNCVRPGLILYGYSPDGNPVPGLDLRPSLTFKALIGDVRRVFAGDSLSYNRTFVADKDMTVAVVSCGYADGVPRALSNRASFLINGHRAKILGNVCMDLTIVDVTDIPDVKPFDEAIVFGGEKSAFLSPFEQAKHAGTISYELLTSISKRVPRTYFSQEA